MSAPFTPEQEARIREIVAERTAIIASGFAPELQPSRDREPAVQQPSDEDMIEAELRLRCLETASREATSSLVSGDDTLTKARRYTAFVLGTVDPTSSQDA